MKDSTSWRWLAYSVHVILWNMNMYSIASYLNLHALLVIIQTADEKK